MQLVRDPDRFDVIVTTNLFGDILCDLTAGLVGGLGLVPGANIGEGAAIFEAVHGTAPDIAGQGIANPTAAMLAGAMMLDRLGHKEPGMRLASAVRRAILLGKDLTPDLGGTGNTERFTDRVISSRAQLTGRGRPRQLSLPVSEAPRARRGDEPLHGNAPNGDTAAHHVGMPNRVDATMLEANMESSKRSSDT